MDNSTNYNFLINDNQRSLQSEFRPVLEHYFQKVFDYEHALIGPGENDPTPAQVKERMQQWVDIINFAVFAVPKGEDGQTRGILLGNSVNPGEIDVLFVHESFRSQKIGAGLIAKFQRTRPTTPLTVEVNVVNHRAKRFYEELGFVFQAENPENPAVVKGTRPLS